MGLLQLSSQGDFALSDPVLFTEQGTYTRDFTAYPPYSKREQRRPYDQFRPALVRDGGNQGIGYRSPNAEHRCTNAHQRQTEQEHLLSGRDAHPTPVPKEQPEDKTEQQ